MISRLITKFTKILWHELSNIMRKLISSHTCIHTIAGGKTCTVSTRYSHVYSSLVQVQESLTHNSGENRKLSLYICSAYFALSVHNSIFPRVTFTRLGRGDQCRHGLKKFRRCYHKSTLNHLIHINLLLNVVKLSPI